MRMRLTAGIVPALLALTGVTSAQTTREGKDAHGSWQADKPGTVRLIRPQDLPAPGSSSANVSHVVARPAGAMPRRLAPGVSAFFVPLTAPRSQARTRSSRAGFTAPSASPSFRAAITRNGSMSPTPITSCAFLTILAT
jgi:hypothetical protein